MNVTLADLAEARRWVAWRNEERDGNLTKIPYFGLGRKAEADDPSTWLTHAAAVAVADTIINGTGGGVGVELGPCGEHWLAGVDFDACRDPHTGTIAPWAQAVMDRLETYAEVSPSGTGVKAFFRLDPADIATLRALMGRQHGRQFKRANGGPHPPAIELYTSNRYFATTWQALDDAPADLRVIPLDDLRWLVEDVGPAFAGKAKAEQPKADNSDTILARLTRAAANYRAIEKALTAAATLAGGSRSEGAFGLGAALKRAGWSHADMKAALLACPATREWASDKLSSEGDRQFERIFERAGENSAKDGTTKEPAPLVLINPSDLADKPVPAREWIVEDWLPVGATTACYGDGGVGKTLLAQQLMTATTIGSAWCGYPLARCRSLGLFCEDSDDELHRRQAQICGHLGIGLDKLGEMRWVSGLGQDNILATFTSSGEMEATKRYYAIATAAKDFGARLVVFDTAADLFGGNENDRGQVRRFIGLLSHLAIEIHGAVLLNAHPSRTGLNSGNLDGGSTAWSNSVRSRWSLARTDTGDEAQHEDTAERILTRRKANYASIGDTIKLRWTNGVLMLGGRRGNTESTGAAARAEADELFLQLLDRCDAQEQRVSESRHASNFAPKVFARRPDAKGRSAIDFERAMGRLFADKRITNAIYGRAGDARQRIARVPNAA